MSSIADIPQRWLRRVSAIFNWKKLDRIRHRLTAGGSPCFDAGRCFLPEWAYLSADPQTRNIARRVCSGIRSGDEKQLMRLMAEIRRNPQTVALLSIRRQIAAWRMTKDIVEIDPHMLSALIESDADSLPAELLLRLPSWGLYISLTDGFPQPDGVQEPVRGVFVRYADRSPAPGSRVPVLLEAVFCCGENGEKVIPPITIDPATKTISEAMFPSCSTLPGMDTFELLFGPVQKAARRMGEPVIRALVAILLYVVSEHEKRTDARSPSTPQIPSPGKARGWRMIPPK
ncbi:MAG: hypothetical protein Q4F72_12765, partial [Desulfovibrionaceae bacterium]|nr:hypothetical protein [Desulfovibrionaceae bacterium]